MQLFHGTFCPCISRSRISDDYFDSSDEEPWEEASDQEEWTTPFKPMRDVTTRSLCCLLTEIDF